MGAPFSQVQAPQTSQGGGKGMFSPQPPTQQNYAIGGPNDPSMTQIDGGQNGQPSQTGQSDGIARPSGKGGQITFPSQSGQPQMGRPNAYSNTVGPWDNASIQPRTQSGKGKGY